MKKNLAITPEKLEQAIPTMKLLMEYVEAQEYHDRTNDQYSHLVKIALELRIQNLEWELSEYGISYYKTQAGFWEMAFC